MLRNRIFSSLIFFIVTSSVLLAQTDKYQLDDWKSTIARSLVSEGVDLKLSNVDIISHHFSEHNGVQHVYFQQNYNGTEVFKAIGNAAFKNDISHFKSSRLVRETSRFINTKSIYRAEDALTMVAQHLDLPLSTAKGKTIRTMDGQYEISQLPYANDEVRIRKVWAKSKEGFYKQSWAVKLTPSVNNDHWEIIVDGNDGSILEKVNSTVYCTHHNHDLKDRKKEFDTSTKSSDKSSTKASDKSTSKSNQKKTTTPGNEASLSKVVDGSRYNVFPLPLESPAAGSRQLVVEPADAVASPFGWHDTDGVAGPEFNILRGNNVHAYPDTAANNSPPEQEISSIGGLTFDFPFDPQGSPEENLNADLTNIFYWTNFMHDWSFHFGFNETSGNFQEKNYGNLGRDGDYVFIETLDASDTGNANFSAPNDGTSGRMQMYKWIVGNDFDIVSPASIGGTYSTGNSSFGPMLSEFVQAPIILAQDNEGVLTDACQTITNGNELAGNIAMIDRGDCDFSFKVFAAQEAGAIGCLICNNEANAPLVTMSAGENANQVRIPSLFLSREDCAIIKAQLSNGVEGRFNETRELSSAFDNGIVVHEYGHGISLRLTGGASTSACLNNDEQAGEGWSDFFTLALTQQPNDNGAKSRPIGTYVLGESRTGRGIRRYPYSTDMNENAQLHSHMRFSFRPHDVGEIWTTVLWDMYWDFIDRDGYDATWQDPSKGNVVAMQLVFDGLKLQECDPSLIESRDAILEADRLNNNGFNQCLIWNAFAKRGLGVDAKDNDTDQRYDNVDGFKTPTSCSGTLSLTKEMTSIIDPGDAINVTLDIENAREPVQNIVVTEEIPEGTTLVEVEGDIEFVQEGNILLFEIGSLNTGDTRQIKYQLNTDDIEHARFDTYDDLEGATQFERATTNNSVRGWSLTTAQSASGIFSLRVSPDTLGSESFATRIEPIEVSEATRLLKFNHKYDLDLGVDGGIVEVSTDQGTTWEKINGDRYLINGMPDVLNNCFNNCPAPDFFYRNTHPAFTGTRDWHTSVVDLSDYMSQTILLRYNHISLTFRDSLQREGWLVDDFELLERKELVGEACISNQANILNCTTDFTLVNSDAGKVPATEIKTDQFSLSLSPNPTSDFLSVELISKESFEGTLRFISVDGRTLGQRDIKVLLGDNNWKQDVSSFIPGMYFVELSDRNKNYTLTFIKQ